MKSIKSQTNLSRHVLTITQNINLVLDRIPDITALKKLHCRILSDPNLQPNAPQLSIKLMQAYAIHGKPDSTRKIFDAIPSKNHVLIWNVMIRSYVNNHLHREAIFMYKRMLSSSMAPDHYTLPCILKACSGSSDLNHGVQIHCASVTNGLNRALFTANGLVAMYGKCGDLVGAKQVFHETLFRDIASWNSMVAAYAHNGRFEEALDMCREMESSGRVKPDPHTMASLSTAVTNTSIENVMLVRKIFSEMDKDWEITAWNVMIAVYAKNSMSSQAIGLYSQMEDHHGIEPDAITIASVLPACGDLSDVSLGKRVHEYVDRKGIRPNLLVENALIDMYAKCGCLQEARKVFNEMLVKDVITWTSMMSAYGWSGDGPRAVGLFFEMRASGLNPDPVAFVSVLSACSHAGLLSDGRFFYRLMIEEYEMVPELEHFACMVDMLGRAGRVDEAYARIKEMPMAPNDRVWGALLGACHVYNDMDIGVMAADRLLQLAPRESGYYQLLSNIYARVGRWKDVALVRSFMRERGVRVRDGVSNVEMVDDGC